MQFVDDDDGGVVDGETHSLRQRTSISNSGPGASQDPATITDENQATTAQSMGASERPDLLAPGPTSARPTLGPPQRSAECQTAALMDFVIIRGALSRYPLMMCVWCPLSITLSGLSYMFHWRVLWTTNMSRVKDGADPPTVMPFLVTFLIFGLFVTHFISIPLLFISVMQHSINADNKKFYFFATLVHVLLVCLPLCTCEMYLVWNPIDGHQDTKASVLATFTAYMQLLTGIMMLWWIYQGFVVDFIVRRVRKVADEYIVETRAYLKKPPQQYDDGDFELQDVDNEPLEPVTGDDDVNQGERRRRMWRRGAGQRNYNDEEADLDDRIRRTEGPSRDPSGYDDGAPYHYPSGEGIDGERGGALPRARLLQR